MLLPYTCAALNWTVLYESGAQHVFISPCTTDHQETTYPVQVIVGIVVLSCEENHKFAFFWGK
jgi:hypothetical protein